MPQDYSWEREYQKPQLLTKKAEPQTDTKNFLRFLRKNEKLQLEHLKVLDLGSGTGRNGNYVAKLGNSVIGLDISPTAVKLASDRAEGMGIDATYRLANFGAPFDFADNYFDVVLDVMSSNSLNEKERAIYLSEVARVLKKGGYFFVRTLCKDGDKNTKNLLKMNPGKEYDTYINQEMGLTERVFSRQDFIDLYSSHFEILRLMPKTNYTRFKGQPYKRNYWLAYMKK
jgi:SAM-dependent methyltransferase